MTRRQREFTATTVAMIAIAMGYWPVAIVVFLAWISGMLDT
jgi:hypothetical protein